MHIESDTTTSPGRDSLSSAEKVMLTDIDAPNSYNISDGGEGGVASFARGGTAVRLEVAEKARVRSSRKLPGAETDLL